MADRTVYGLIASEEPPALQRVLSSASGRSKCGRPIDTSLSIQRIF
jgi:hypothetical protein